MRLPQLVLCCFLFGSASAQAPSVPFLTKLVAQITAGNLPTSVSISGSATLVIGSQTGTGTAQLQAAADGSMLSTLTLDTNSRTDTSTAWSSDRACSWESASGKQTTVTGPNCLLPVPWFAPAMVGPNRLAESVALVDDGEMAFAGSTLHRLSFSPVFTKQDAATLATKDRSTVHVYYDPLSLQVIALEYSIHANENEGLSIPVTVVFTDYRPVKTFSLPYHIERYVNGVKQLTIDASTVTAS